MILIKVSNLMGKYKLNQKQLCDLTGIRPNTMSQLWHGTSKRIEIEQIDKLCAALKCTPGDLFEYIPEK